MCNIKEITCINEFREKDFYLQMDTCMKTRVQFFMLISPDL